MDPRNYFVNEDQHELIAPLPRMRTVEEYFDTFEQGPCIDDIDRKAGKYVRLYKLSQIREFRSGREFGYRMELEVAKAIRKGYRLSVPRDGMYHKSPYKKTEGDYIACTLYGKSGIGKTTAIMEVLSRYPQVIPHEHQNYKFMQISYIVVTCPPTCSMKNFYDNCLDALENAIGTEIPERRRYKTVDEKMRLFKNNAIKWNLGLLVIDEIQNVMAKPSENLLNQFTTLSNELKVPIIYVGTSPIIEYFSTKAFANSRRMGTEIRAERYMKDQEWDRMISCLWQYQWMQEYVPLTEALSETLFRESGGIVGRSVDLFMAAQEQAILCELDTIAGFTPGFLSSISDGNYESTRRTLHILADGGNQNSKLLPPDLRELDASYAIQANSLQSAAELKLEASEPKTPSRKEILRELQNDVIPTVMEVVKYLPVTTNRQEVKELFDQQVKSVKTERLDSTKISKQIIENLNDNYAKNLEVGEKETPVFKAEDLSMYGDVI